MFIIIVVILALVSCVYVFLYINWGQAFRREVLSRSLLLNFSLVISLNKDLNKTY